MSRVQALPSVGRVLVILGLAVLAACGDSGPTAPTEPRATGNLLGSSSGPKLVECPTDETKTKTALIGAMGGTLAIDGTSVVFPAGALPGLTTVTLTIPASKYVEITVETDGPDYFPVKQPIVTISYSRCQRTDVLTKPLTAWYIDSETKDLLEEMISTDNKLTQSVTFTTFHFSGYAVAF
jgi:hypothetical protein